MPVVFEAKLTVRPDVAEAAAVKAGEPTMTFGRRVLKVIVCGVGFTVNV
jgi:hypothetical protein